FCLLIASGARAQVQSLDRVVASVGKTAITESDVLQEYRLEKFLDDGRVPVDLPGPQEMQKLRDRLIDQNLLEIEEEDSTAATEVSAGESRQRLAKLEKKFPNEKAFEAALLPLGIKKQQLLGEIASQQRILHIVDERLRPAAVVDSADVQDYYQRTLLPQLARAGNRNPPPLPEVEAKIREILVQKRMNQLLTRWLSQLRSAQHVELLPM
ncbi:MAG: hypothetical protein ACREP9_17350, partial [Candidatus Dormibacteraceae bacterium]